MITKALIENFRETVKPVVSQLLFGVNYEGMGTLDCEEFERDFDEILDLALAGYEQKVNNAVSTLDGNKNDMVYRQQAIDKINERQRKLIYCFGFENDAVKIMDIAKSIISAIPPAQPETAKRIVGKSRDGMILWYQCAMCNEPVDEQDDYCRGCGRRFERGSD